MSQSTKKEDSGTGGGHIDPVPPPQPKAIVSNPADNIVQTELQAQDAGV